MNITYLVDESRFYAHYRSEIERARQELLRGQSLTLSPGSEPPKRTGSATVRVGNKHEAEFASAWNDPEHFPAGIKAAVTALRDCDCPGVYRLQVHKDGSVSNELGDAKLLDGE